MQKRGRQDATYWQSIQRIIRCIQQYQMYATESRKGPSFSSAETAGYTVWNLFPVRCTGNIQTLPRRPWLSHPGAGRHMHGGQRRPCFVYLTWEQSALKYPAVPLLFISNAAARCSYPCIPAALTLVNRACSALRPHELPPLQAGVIDNRLELLGGRTRGQERSSTLLRLKGFKDCVSP